MDGGSPVPKRRAGPSVRSAYSFPFVAEVSSVQGAAGPRQGTRPAPFRFCRSCRHITEQARRNCMPDSGTPARAFLQTVGIPVRTTFQKGTEIYKTGTDVGEKRIIEPCARSDRSASYRHQKEERFSDRSSFHCDIRSAAQAIFRNDSVISTPCPTNPRQPGGVSAIAYRGLRLFFFRLRSRSCMEAHSS